MVRVTHWGANGSRSHPSFSKDCCQFVTGVIKKEMVRKWLRIHLHKTPFPGDAVPVVVAASTNLTIPSIQGWEARQQISTGGFPKWLITNTPKFW